MTLGVRWCAISWSSAVLFLSPLMFICSILMLFLSCGPGLGMGDGGGGGDWEEGDDGVGDLGAVVGVDEGGDDGGDGDSVIFARIVLRLSRLCGVIVEDLGGGGGDFGVEDDVVAMVALGGDEVFLLFGETRMGLALPYEIKFAMDWVSVLCCDGVCCGGVWGGDAVVGVVSCDVCGGGDDVCVW